MYIRIPCRMSTEGLSHHISSRYNEDLERLRSSVLEMGGLVERQLGQAIGGITEPDAKVMLRVAQEELRVNQLERSIDEDCSRILATRGPGGFGSAADHHHPQDDHRPGAHRR